MPQGGDRKPQTVLVTKGVKLTSDDGLEVTSDQANYDERTGVVTVPGAVQFTKGRMTGSGVGATYDQNRNVLWLLDRATLNVKPDAAGAGAAEATAKGMGMARNEHFVRLVENAHIVGEGRTLDANEIDGAAAARRLDDAEHGAARQQPDHRLGRRARARRGCPRATSI